MAGCRRARVTILSVNVSKSESYGLFGEPGGSAEWDLVFTVAGQQERRRINGVRDGSVLGINLPFVVDLNSLQEELQVSVSGQEIDDSSKNDSIPAAIYRIVPVDNWVEGQTLDAAASSKDFSYTFSFRIECAEALASTSDKLTTSEPEVTSGVGAAAWTKDRLDVLGRGLDNALWHRWFDNGSWHNWESLGGVLTSGPAAVSWGTGRLDVLGRGQDNALWHR